MNFNSSWPGPSSLEAIRRDMLGAFALSSELSEQISSGMVSVQRCWHKYRLPVHVFMTEQHVPCRHRRHHRQHRRGRRPGPTPRATPMDGRQSHRRRPPLPQATWDGGLRCKPPRWRTWRSWCRTTPRLASSSPVRDPPGPCCHAALARRAGTCQPVDSSGRVDAGGRQLAVLNYLACLISDGHCTSWS